ncbi:hypothetical protein D8B26_003084 [Coccidioides posadasii str. Silveira]|uniref:uncharacterized protein n=1 Tax=Coccidioides posadasii (strain RMSCC 757 / Silveira) TaxID=443226 RepID=UPI001BF0CB47|nr:hypothetical protein D8B26_003084 [Coccidioides posadasii str. Silveira]
MDSTRRYRYFQDARLMGRAAAGHIACGLSPSLATAGKARPRRSLWLVQWLGVVWSRPKITRDLHHTPIISSRQSTIMPEDIETASQAQDLENTDSAESQAGAFAGKPGN